MPVQGRPIEDWEKDERAAPPPDADAKSPALKAWLRTLGEHNFREEAVPDPDMADWLGGTVSVTANRAGQTLPSVK